MAEVQLEIGGRTYPVSCRDGEEDHLRAIALLVDTKATEARAAVGTGGEVRQLLLASLLLADELQEARASGNGAASAPTHASTPTSAPEFEDLAERLEALASRLEKSSQSA
jgi:cell division protein ZapA